MAYLNDAMTWATEEAALKAYLGITDASEDANLQAWLDSATTAGDTFMENPFVDDDDLDIPIPAGVKIGVYEWIRVAREFYLQNNTGGVTSVKTDTLSQSWSGTGFDPSSAPLDAARPHWWSRNLTKWR